MKIRFLQQLTIYYPNPDNTKSLKFVPIFSFNYSLFPGFLLQSFLTLTLLSPVSQSITKPLPVSPSELFSDRHSHCHPFTHHPTSSLHRSSPRLTGKHLRGLSASLFLSSSLCMVTSVIQLNTHLTLTLPCLTFCSTFSLHRMRSQFSHVPYRFQQPPQFLPWGCISMSGRRYWHLVPRGQEC